MTDKITVTGFVATQPIVKKVTGDLLITSFRIASNQRRFDKGRDRWIDGETNWFTITAFRHLAANVGASVVKGDRIVVHGRLRVRDWEAADNKKGTNVEIEADALGHDLSWGTTAFTRVSLSTGAANDDGSAAPGEDDADVFPDDVDDDAAVHSDSLWGAPGVVGAGVSAGAGTTGDGDEKVPF
jgi:single-strand DNA-binding protein